MSNSADRMRDTIHAAANLHGATEGQEFVTLGTLLAALRDDLDSYNDTVARFVASTAETFSIHDDLAAELRDDLYSVANRVESVTQAMATRADLDDLRHEVMEAVATPFDPPEAA